MACLIFSACKKEKTTAPADPETPISQTDTSLKCADLPAPPPIGWKDSSASQDKNINAFFFNPLNPNELIYIANGDLFGYNKMYLYNIPTKQAKYLSDTGSDLPHVNSKGWIVFGRSDFNVYKVKTSGDSLTQLTTNNISHDPKWDKDGNHIFFYQSASAVYPSALVEATKNGGVVNTTPTELANTAFAHRSNRIAYLKTGGNTVSIYYRDLAVNSETLLISAQGTAETLETLFSNLTFDNADENLYWSNQKGIFKCSLATAKMDVVKKNCPNLIYDRPVMAANSDELTFSCHFMKALGPSVLLHQYKAFELDLNSNQLHEVRVFPQ